jgi:hypothetical protein
MTTPTARQNVKEAMAIQKEIRKRSRWNTTFGSGVYRVHCPKCKKIRVLSYYHGMLGYESFVCPVCHWDIKEGK